MAPKDVSGPDDDPIHDKPMPLLEHLVELRRRLLWSLAAFLIAFGVCYYFSKPIYSFLAEPLAALAAITRSLPDDTYLTDFTLNGRNVTLNGQSASAAKLIGLLAADPSIDNPAFSAPVTRLEATHTDLFSIRAAVLSSTDGPAADLTLHAPETR